MENKRQELEAVAAELHRHEEIMEQLSKVKGCEGSYVYINGNCYYWSVSALDPNEACQIARRENHEELLYMIHQYGKAAPPQQWQQRHGNPYTGQPHAHILPNEVQKIIARRCDWEEIKAFSGYQGFNAEAQAVFYKNSNHDLRMYYLERHGFCPAVQDMLRRDGNQEEIDLHISRHGMHPGWEKEVIESQNFELLRHCVDLHEFSVAGQRLICRADTPSDFFRYYVKKRGLWEEVHADLAEHRNEDDLRFYLRYHPHLSFDGELALCRFHNHETMMFYIGNKCHSTASLEYAFKKTGRHNYIEILACCKRSKNPDFYIKEAEFMKNGSERDILEYLEHNIPGPDALSALSQRGYMPAIERCLTLLKK